MSPSARLPRLIPVAWLAGMLLAALALGWLAVRLQAYFAPVLLFPLLLGMALGGGGVWLARRIGFASPKGLWGGIVLAALVMSLVQHYFAYRAHVAALADAQRKQPQIAIFTEALPELAPRSLADYLAAEARRPRWVLGWAIQGRGAWLLWGLEGALTVAGSLLVVGTRKP